MYFKQFLDDVCGCASYCIASCCSGEAAIIDPGCQTEQYEHLLHQRGLLLRYVIDTHIHADHLSGACTLADRYGATLCLHQTAQVAYPFHPLADGDELHLWQICLRVLHTPGHRPELISLLVTDTARTPSTRFEENDTDRPFSEVAMALTGDSLLVGDVGRPDFAGGDAVAQYESLQRLLRLPDWVAVFPGHFEGPCGKGMSGWSSTTIGLERRYNPMTQLARDPFIATLTSGVPARPLNMTAIEPTNRGLAAMQWAMLTTSPPVPEVELEELEASLYDKVLLDVREPEEYRRGHLPGAINLPQAEVATRLAEAPHGRPIRVICWSGARSHRVAQFLLQLGYTQVANVSGGVAAWSASGRVLTGADRAGSCRE